MVDEPGTPGKIEFVLRTDLRPARRLWRALALVDNSNGTQFAIVENDKSNMGGPNTMSDTVERLGIAYINIQKAKAFGVHTGMYDLRNLTEKAGRRVTFIWRRFG